MDAPAFCGGIAGFRCPAGQTCVDDPADDCDPNAGGADCGGICVDAPAFCGGIAGFPCPAGETCIDDPADDCDPNAGGADCGGICVELPAACSAVRIGEYGNCRAIIGWGIQAATGACGIISGCGCDATCEGRVFDTEAACQRACPEPPCPDADNDGACDVDDSTCSTDGQPLACRRVAPVCARGTVPEVTNGCYTDRCVTWAECVRLQRPPCDADQDGDGICDGQDTECNADGTQTICDRIPQICRAPLVPEVRDGCYTGQCVAWADCGVDAPRMCGGIAGLRCPVGQACVDDPSDRCDPANGGADCPGICEDLAVRCGGIAGLPCPVGFACVDDPNDRCDPANGGADCPGICLGR